MKLTTLCYIKNEGRTLLLHRVKKQNDENEGKWIGVGGKLEAGESPEDCVKREALEESGLTLASPRFRGIITFVSDIYGTEYMFLFTCDSFSGEIRTDCDEGLLKWVNDRDIRVLPMWEGDRIFLSLLDTDREFFSLKLVYEGDSLICAYLDGEKIQ